MFNINKRISAPYKHVLTKAVFDGEMIIILFGLFVPNQMPECIACSSHILILSGKHTLLICYFTQLSLSQSRVTLFLAISRKLWILPALVKHQNYS